MRRLLLPLLLLWSATAVAAPRASSRVHAARPAAAAAVKPAPVRIGGTARKGYETPAPPAWRSKELAPHMALGLPSAPRADVQILPRRGFVSIYDSARKVPLLVSWATTKAMLGNDASVFNERKDAFHEDTRFEGPQASLADFHKSGYARGHLVRQGERPLRLDREANESTFSLVNIVPQARESNSGPWKHFENYYRDHVFETGDTAYVLAGTLFEGPKKTIGDGVHVPSHLYKIVVLAPAGLDPRSFTSADIGKSVKVTAIVVPNDGDKLKMTDHFGKFVVPVAEIERRAGMDLLSRLPEEARAAVRARVPSLRPDDVEGREGMYVDGAWIPRMWPFAGAPQAN